MPFAVREAFQAAAQAQVDDMQAMDKGGLGQATSVTTSRSSSYGQLLCLGVVTRRMSTTGLFVVLSRAPPGGMSWLLWVYLPPQKLWLLHKHSGNGSASRHSERTISRNIVERYMLKGTPEAKAAEETKVMLRNRLS